MVKKGSAPLVYAIDFGTSNSLLAAADAERVYDPAPLDPDASNPTILRSILFFPTMKQVYYGARAIQEFVAHDLQGRLVRSIKKFLPVRSFIGTYVEDRPLNLEDIIGLFLKEMRARANEHYGQDVDRAVLGRPARFSENDGDDLYAQSRLEKSARIAGFKHIEFLPEPVAAAREFRHKLDQPKTVLVADFGGGTSDYTVIRLGGKEFEPSDVLAIGGVALAGDSIDGSLMRNRISRHFGSDVEYKVPFGSNVLTMPKGLMERICSPADISLLRKRDTMEFFRNVRQWSLGEDDREKVDRLFSLINDQLGFGVFEEIERAKRTLSESDQTLFNYQYPDIDIQETITRPQFDDAAHDRITSILTSLDDALRRAQVTADQIDLVCCTGGTAKVAAIREGLAHRFGTAKLQQHNHFHSIVQGLAERARDLARIS